MKKKFDVYCDPGHGWMKVKKSLLVVLGITDRISQFSYMRNEYAYLEEDCDASTFVGAYEEKYGIHPQYRFHHSDKLSRIRNYNSFTAI